MDRRAAVDRALHYLEAWDQKPRFDAAIAALDIGGDAWTALGLRWLTATDPDGGHPHRRLWDPAMRLPRDLTSTWSATAAKPPSVNRVITEALYCPENGFRPESATWLCGGMRDGAGYGTTHAAWAAYLLERQGCPPPPCVDALRAELTDALAAAPAPRTTADADLRAERLLAVQWLRSDDPRVSPWLDALARDQRPDGAWGDPATAPDPDWTLHATATSAWALALSLR